MLSKCLLFWILLSFHFTLDPYSHYHSRNQTARRQRVFLLGECCMTPPSFFTDSQAVSSINLSCTDPFTTAARHRNSQ